MRPLVVGTYPPRLCGIATFTADVVDAMSALPEVKRPAVAAVTRCDEPRRPHAVSSDVGAVIEQENWASYRAAALVANTFDVVLIEHEFGIFGGPDGEMLLAFVDALDVPFVVALHTVLPSPTANQKRVLRRLCERAAAVMVFTATARRILLDQGVARAGKVRIVPHGAPSELFERRDADDAKSVFGVFGRPVVSTFGLLSSGKGIEVALRAIDSVRDVVPDVVYIVAGQTHPGVLHVEGERYREELLRLVDALDLADNVRFVDRFMDVDDLAQLLSATDVFCTPYHNGDQIVSGALTFAIAAGRPTVSTPYRYAEDLLGDGAGRLVPFDSPEPLAVELVELLTCPEALARAQRAAERTGASLSWPEVGRHTADVLWEAMQSHRLRGWTPRFDPAALPRVDTDLAPVQTSTAHLRAMVDDTGIFQHAHGQVPALEHGYCVDDVARVSCPSPTHSASATRCGRTT